MKISKLFLLFFITTAVLTGLMSCNPNQDTGTGDIPKSTMSIPGALTADSSSRTSRATGATGTAESFFEPFRSSLAIAEEVLNFVNGMIDSLNSSTVPDSYNGMAGDYYVTVTTDTDRTYSKRIDFKSSETADQAFLQVNYTPGTVKGVLYYIEEDSTSDLEKIKVFYDETGTYPVLTGWVSIKAGAADETYPKNIYFNATKNSSGKIVFEGGVGYHFVFGGDATYTTDNVSERVYMYKALCSSDGTKAEVALYFPEESVTVTAVPESMNIKNSFLDILFDWLETDNGQDLDGGAPWLDTSYGTITSGSTLGTAIAGYVDEGGTLDDSLAFVINLTNNIAYSEESGYEGNDATFPAAYDMGDLSGITFSEAPDSIAGLAADSAIFTFLTD